MLRAMSCLSMTLAPLCAYYATVQCAAVCATHKACNLKASESCTDICCMLMQVSDAQKNVGSNHAVSGLKFKILHHFLQLGYSVLLSDVDIVTIQNPFSHLHRDSDIEAMSDGWDNATAYGKNVQRV